MRDRKKFCRPKITKYPKVGDVYVKLPYGKIVAVSANEFEKIKDLFRIESMVGEANNIPGNLEVINKKLNYTTIIEPSSYNEKIFDLIKVIGDKDGDFSTGDIKLYNETLNRNIIVSFEDWLKIGDSWNITEIYNINTYSEDEAEEGDYVILSNGTTFIIKPDDYSSISDHWEHVDTIHKNTEE